MLARPSGRTATGVGVFGVLLLAGILCLRYFQGTPHNRTPVDGPSAPNGVQASPPRSGGIPSGSTPGQVTSGELFSILKSQPAEDWPAALASLELRLLASETRASLIAQLVNLAHSEEEPSAFRMLCCLLLGRTAPGEARNRLLDLLSAASGRVALAVGFAVHLSPPTEESEKHRVNFWTGLLAGFDIGEVLAPGYRQRLSNRLRGLPADAPPSVRSDDASPIPFESYSYSQVDDPVLEARIVGLIRETKDGAIREYAWLLLKDASGRAQLYREALFDASYPLAVRIDAAKSLRSSSPGDVVLAASLEQDVEAKAGLLKVASHLADSKETLDLLAQSIRANSSSDHVLLAMADGVSRAGSQEGVAMLVRVAAQTTEVDVRARLIRSLSQASKNAQADHLKENGLNRLLESADPSIRRQALDALWMLRGPKAKATIQAIAQNDSSLEVRSAAQGLLDQPLQPRK